MLESLQDYKKRRFYSNRILSMRTLLYSAIIIIALCLVIGEVIAAASFAEPDSILTASVMQGQEAVYSAHEHHNSPTGGADAGITLEEGLLFAGRAAYYFMLLIASGILLLTKAIPANQSEEQRLLVSRWSQTAMRGLLLAVLVYIFFHANQLMGGFGGDVKLLELFTLTSAGNIWLMLLALSVLGFGALRLPAPLQALWALLLLGVESYSGHAAATGTTAIIFDFIHLVCSALWAAGVLLLVMLWRANRKEAGRFAERFTTIAFISIIALTISGIVMTWLLLPSWLYLLYTTWGKWLLVKTALVLFVVVLGIFLRRRAKRGELPRGSLLKLDGSLMGAIIVIVGVFTYISPEPSNLPLNFHEMGDELHYTLAISPNGPGPNRVSLKVWLPSELGAPEQISLRFQFDNRPQSQAIEIPLQQVEAERAESFPGFLESNYKADSIHLPYVGSWTAELIIADQLGGELKREVQFRNK